TGNDLSLANTKIEVLDRAGWIRANMVNFRYLLQPVEDFYKENASKSKIAAPPGFQQAARMMLGSQMGVLVGYLSRRVLGQYDIALLGEEPITAGKLYFVEPNLRMVEETLGVPPDELRRWIALHEATHAHEFEVYPWVREYLNNSLRQYLKLLIDDMRGRDGGEGSMMAIINRFIGNLRQGHNVINALMSAQQRELMSRLQGLMALAEGYSNHVMNQVGKELLPNFELIHQRVEHRQKRRSNVEQLFLKITGLSLKMEQYRLGELFVDDVVSKRGIAFVNRAWQAPENLPSEAEIRNPGAWIGRMEAVQVA
ncbi:MAG TPA: zinc-dependent metalloprotease, partial [Chloroflexota bacterium]|nr:zinc-dependent metalloprotease [Chloroflexota bacterium]